jgi:SDR family mycofactocin-dependent oxidoreductase
MGRLDGKVAFITGGARGQGRAIAGRLAIDGADILICDVTRDIDALEYSLASDADAKETVALVEVAGRRCEAVVADVRRQDELDRAVARGIDVYGQIDILVANAGIIDYKPFWEISDDEWQTMQDINLAGVWRSAKAVSAHMRARISGSMVFTSSINGLEGGWNYAHYIAAKHGVLGLMKAIGLELAPFGIRVNAVCPTVMDAPINTHPKSYERVVGRKGATYEDWLAATKSWHALRGRGALPSSAVADAVAWLVSDDARHITGAQVPVDAGHLLLPGGNPAPIAGEGPEHETLDPWPALPD